MFAALLADRKQRLLTHAHAEKRPVRRDVLAHRLDHRVLAQIAHRIRRRADARQDHRIGVRHIIRILGHARLVTGVRHRPRDAAQVPRTVVDDDDLHSGLSTENTECTEGVRAIHRCHRWTQMSGDSLAATRPDYRQRLLLACHLPLLYSHHAQPTGRNPRVPASKAPHRGAALAHRLPRASLLRPRPAGDLRCGVRRPHAQATRARGAASGADHAGLAHAARRRRARRDVRHRAAPRAAAVARQRVRRR